MNETAKSLVNTAKERAIESASLLRDAAVLLDGENDELAGQLRASAKTIRNAGKRFADK